MSGWTAARVARVLGTAAPVDGTFTGIGTDTRSLEPGALFVALTGERFDGHDFLAPARELGARAAVVRAGTPPVAGLPLFEVDDPLRALGRLAQARRSEIAGPVVAVTGTNGKTATKEFVAAALSVRWRVHYTRGNLNNLVGVPLTILAAPADAEALVAEAGASVPGEIARLRTIIAPTVAVITNVAAGHVEGFGSLEGVLAEKLALAAGAPLAVVGAHPPTLAARAREVATRVVVAGRDPAAAVRPDAWTLDEAGRATFTLGGVRVRLSLVGAHQVDNAVLALTVARELGVSLAAAAPALGRVVLPPGRCQVLSEGSLTVLHDAYNANPSSLEAALDTADALRRDRPLVVVLGTMLELGEASERLHAEMAERVLARAPSLVAATGAFAAAFGRHAGALGSRLVTADDPDTLGVRLAERLRGDELILLKASRGVRLERVIPHLLPGVEVPCSTTC